MLTFDFLWLNPWSSMHLVEHSGGLKEYRPLEVTIMAPKSSMRLLTSDWFGVTHSSQDPWMKCVHLSDCCHQNHEAPSKWNAYNFKNNFSSFSLSECRHGKYQ